MGGKRKVGSKMETHKGRDLGVAALDKWVGLDADDPTRELLVDFTPGDERSVVLHARYADIARRLILTPNLRRVADETGYSTTGLKYVVAHPEFQQVYRSVYQAIYGSIDETLANEQLDIYRRTQSLSVRAVTLLSEIMSSVRQHIKDAPVTSAAKLKAGVDAAAQVRLFQETAMSAHTKAAPTSIHIRADKVDVIRSAINESGVDLSDVIEGVIVDESTQPNG